MTDAPLFQSADEQEDTGETSQQPVADYQMPDQPSAIPAGLTPGGQINAGLHGLPAVLPPDIAPQAAPDEIAERDPTTPR